VSTVALIGNPNCGKTSLFNGLTGANQRVGNWPGVTVERREGRYRHAGAAVTVVDLPGIYGLDADGAGALDAHIAHDYLLSGAPDAVLNVVDASNLERNLYLTAQLLELGLPVVVALTMNDVARSRRRPVDADALADRLGCPVVPVNPRRTRGIPAVRAALAAPLAPGARGPAYPAAVERALTRLEDGGAGSRGRALALLAGDGEAATPGLGELVAIERRDAEHALAEDLDIVLADRRFGFAREVVSACSSRTGVLRPSLTDRIDRVVLNRWLGIPVFLAVMYLLFLLTIDLGGAFIDLFDILAGALFVEVPAAALEAVGAPEALLVLAEGAGTGLQTVATFIPIVGALFLFLSALEDSGYLARAAFVMDRALRAIGLPGRSVVPLLLGFGCNVPAVMATRTLESRRDRVMTAMMAPFMSCGARLPVYALFAVVFFPAAGQNLVFGLYLAGMVAAVFTALVLRATLLRGRPTPFVLELPPYHLPAPRTLLLHSWERLRGFVVGAGRIIVPMVVVLTVLGSIPMGTQGGEQRTVLDQMSRAITPAFAPMGIDEQNWPATVGIVTGVFAKEALVGTLDSLYGSLADGDEEPFSIGARAEAALATVGANLAALPGKLTDPLGLSITASESRAAAAAEQGVGAGTFAEIERRFDGTAGALAFLLFVLLYMPCAAATGAVFRETGTGWTLFAALWTTGLAFLVATIAYQGLTFGRHPESSAAWILGLLAGLAAVVAALRIAGTRRSRRARAGAPVFGPEARTAEAGS
jgi:ferrous iron transport protein B